MDTDEIHADTVQSDQGESKVTQNTVQGDGNEVRDERIKKHKLKQIKGFKRFVEERTRTERS